MVVHLTLVRHGESVDNLVPIWAGHKDAELSNHGFQQAQRVAEAFADVPIHAIFASDLKRAHSTARSIQSHNLSAPPPPFLVTTLLREQYFGEAEAQPWDSGPYSNSPYDNQRLFKFPEGECLEDVAKRAEAFLSKFLVPHLKEEEELSAAAKEMGESTATSSVSTPAASSTRGRHLLITSHGIMISELARALHRAQGNSNPPSHRGLVNTGWSRFEISVLDPSAFLSSASNSIPSTSSFPSNTDQSSPFHIQDLENEPTPEIPPLKVRILNQNVMGHLQGLVRQPGGMSNIAHDDKQQKLTEFFGGGGQKM